MYRASSTEYRVNTRHHVASQLASIILRGAADYDRLPDDVVRKRVGGVLLPLFVEVEALPTLVGVSTVSPTRLHASLDAFTRLPDATISDRELAHMARADFADFWLDMSGQAAGDAAAVSPGTLMV
jgi:hypothetical protein